MNDQIPPTVPPPAQGKQENDWVLFTHLSGLAWIVGIPSFLGPLVFWLLKKEEFGRVDYAGKEAVNFHLTMLIIELISVPLIFLFGIGFITLIIAAIFSLVFPIIATVAASKGEDYVYPMTFRFIS